MNHQTKNTQEKHFIPSVSQKRDFHTSFYLKFVIETLKMRSSKRAQPFFIQKTFFSSLKNHCSHSFINHEISSEQQRKVSKINELGRIPFFFSFDGSSLMRSIKNCFIYNYFFKKRKQNRTRLNFFFDFWFDKD